MGWSEIGTLFGTLLAIAVVLLLAYLTTRFVAKRGSSGRGLFSYKGQMGEHIRILERVSLGREQSLTVVCVGKQCLLLGVTTAGITLIKELSQEEAELWKKRTAPPVAREDASLRFVEAMREAIHKKK